MINLKVEGLDRAIAAVRNGERHAAFVSMRALNDLAFSVMREGQKQMQQVFDRPTPYTIKSWRVLKRATKSDLATDVGMSDFLSSKNIGHGGPAQKLYQQFHGGPRSRKGLEMALQTAGLLKRGELLVAGSAARFDRYGNVSSGQVAQIMSQLKLGADKSSASSTSTRSRRNQARAGRFIFSTGTGKTRRLARGIWVVVDKHRIAPIFLAVSKAIYRKRLDLDALGDFIVRRDFDALFAKHWAQAIATAK